MTACRTQVESYDFLIYSAWKGIHELLVPSKDFRVRALLEEKYLDKII
jgi:hypothetical protein